MKTVKEMMSELRRIVDRFFAAIRNRVKDCIVAGTIVLLLAFFTYTTVVDWLNMLVAGVIGLLLGFFYGKVVDLLDLLVATAIGSLLAFTYITVVDCLNIEGQALKTSIIHSIVYFPILVILWRDKFLKYRKLSLLGAGILGLGLATGVLILINKSSSNSCTVLYEIVTFIKTYEVLVSSITILTLGLPTFFTLWLFRTHDTHENINNSTFFECARLLATKDPDEYKEENRIKDSLPNKIALEQLVYLKRETSFDKKKIDLLTRNLSLGNKEFNYAQLSGINLYSTDLKKAILFNADLRNADLRFAKLRDAELITADLRFAKLSGADLSNAILRGADLRNTDLGNAKLIGTDLKPAKSSDSDFSKPTDLRDAKLIGTNLSGADLSKTDLRGTNLEKIIYDNTTIFSETLYNSKTIFTGTDFENNKEKRDEVGMIDEKDLKN